MKTWFTSDTHFGHRNICKYTHRPYADVQEMNEGIIELWNATVSDDDTVIHCGDFSCFTPRQCYEIIPRLKGKITLLVGNHDCCYDFWKKEKAERIRKEYLEKGFDKVMKDTTGVLISPYTNKRYVIHMNHFPSRKPLQDQLDDRYLEDRFVDNPDEYYVHGHIHGLYQKWDNCIDVGWDVSHRLFSEDDLVQIIEDPRLFIPTHLTETKREFFESHGCLIPST